MSNTTNIRASALPKLAECPRFAGKPGEAGPAAQRGTRMDEAFRLLMQGNHTAFDALEDVDRPAVLWASNIATDMAGGAHVETRDEYLRMAVPGISVLGTADALCVDRGWVADLKTGSMRNYKPQLAAYALACMEDTFASEWTGHVLYCDEQKVASYVFTYAQAKAITNNIIAEVNDPWAEPRNCEYCQWCAHSDTCTARIKPTQEALSLIAETNMEEIRRGILADPEKLGRFLTAWKLAEKEIAEPVIEAAKEMLMQEEVDIPGWKATSVSGREFFSHLAIVQAAAASRCGLDSLVLAMGGTMSGTKFRQWCADLGVPVDESFAQRGAPSTQLRATSGRKSKKESK